MSSPTSFTVATNGRMSGCSADESDVGRQQPAGQAGDRVCHDNDIGVRCSDNTVDGIDRGRGPRFCARFVVDRQVGGYDAKPGRFETLSHGIPRAAPVHPAMKQSDNGHNTEPMSSLTIRSSARSATAAMVIDGLHAAVDPGISAPSST
jgi:hypothetical protein